MEHRQVNINADSSVVMKNGEWQQVLTVLRKGRYDRVAPLIDKIISQCMQQAYDNAGNRAA